MREIRLFLVKNNFVFNLQINFYQQLNHYLKQIITKLEAWVTEMFKIPQQDKKIVDRIQANVCFTILCSIYCQH